MLSTQCSLPSAGLDPVDPQGRACAHSHYFPRGQRAAAGGGDVSGGFLSVGGCNGDWSSSGAAGIDRAGKIASRIALEGNLAHPFAVRDLIDFWWTEGGDCTRRGRGGGRRVCRRQCRTWVSDHAIDGVLPPARGLGCKHHLFRHPPSPLPPPPALR